MECTRDVFHDLAHARLLLVHKPKPALKADAVLASTGTFHKLLNFFAPSFQTSNPSHLRLIKRSWAFWLSLRTMSVYIIISKHVCLFPLFQKETVHFSSWIVLRIKYITVGNMFLPIFPFKIIWGFPQKLAKPIVGFRRIRKAIQFLALTFPNSQKL